MLILHFRLHKLFIASIGHIVQIAISNGQEYSHYGSILLQKLKFKIILLTIFFGKLRLICELDLYLAVLQFVFTRTNWKSENISFQAVLKSSKLRYTEKINRVFKSTCKIFVYVH